MVCDLSIVLLGKNGSENSRIRNSILGIDLHECKIPSGLQQHCMKVSGTVKNRQIIVINTFHLLNPNISDHQITETVRECVYLSDPGPHVFILVLQYNDFTEEDLRRVKRVLKQFNEEAIKRTIVLTTDKDIRSYMIPVKKPSAIHDLIEECGGEHLQLDERKPEWQSEIFMRVDMIEEKSMGKYLICKIHEDVKITSVNAERSRAQEGNAESSHHKDHKEAKERQKNKKYEVSVIFSGKEKLNLVLCGTDGTLKVSVSNLLRGKEIKHSYKRACSEVCVKKEEELHGRLISLVELPVINQLSEEEVMCQTLRCVSLCDPGVHAFLLIIPDVPLTNHEKAELEKIQKIFDSREHFILLFSSSLSVEEHVKDSIKSNPESQRLISLYGDQYRVMGLKEPENPRQIPDLLDYIEKMKTKPYSLQTYVKAQENRVRCETEEKYKEELKKMENEIQELKQKMESDGVEDQPNDPDCMRIVLIGRTGSGKSATGNTILGRDEFQSQLSTDSVTTVCQKGVGEVDARSVAVVDTPGIFDTTLSNDHVVEEIMKCVSMSLPGPHVFVIVLSLGRFTNEEAVTVDLIKKIFGPKAARFSIVLFSRGDDLENESIQDYVERSNSAELKKLIRDCGNRFLAFNNREKRDRTQVIHLLNMIEEVKNSNQGRYFTNCMFEEAEMSIKKRMEEIMKEREREMQDKREELQGKYDMDMKITKKRLEEEKRKANEERMKMENQFREKEEKLRKDFEDHEKTEQKKREIENQNRLEEEKQQRAQYHQKIEEMKREIENKRFQYEKQQKEREEEDRKREEKYRQDQEKIKNEQKLIIAQLRMKQEEEIKKRELEEEKRNKDEKKERQEWEKRIKAVENEKKETQEEIKRKQREWEDEKKRQTREREEEERKRKEKHEKNLREKQEELENMRKKFEREREEERQKIEKERQKERREREEQEKEYKGKKTEMERIYEQLERGRKEQWERRKREDDQRQKEERNRWERYIEDLKREREEEIKRREREENERKGREEKERVEMMKAYEEKINDMQKKHEDEARKQAEEFSDFKEKNLQKLLDEVRLKDKEVYDSLNKIVEHLEKKSNCIIM